MTGEEMIALAEEHDDSTGKQGLEHIIALYERESKSLREVLANIKMRLPGGPHHAPNQYADLDFCHAQLEADIVKGHFYYELDEYEAIEEARANLGRQFAAAANYSALNGYGAVRLDRLSSFEKAIKDAIEAGQTSVVFCDECQQNIKDCNCPCSNCGFPVQEGEHEGCAPF